MNPNENTQSLGISIGLPNSSNKGFDIKAGVIDNTNTYNPNNNFKLYDSKDTYNRIPSVNAIVCYINCDGFISNHTSNNAKQTIIDSNPVFSNTESNTNIESTNQNNTNQPFTYQDSNIQAKEVINDDNTSTLAIELPQDLLEYKGNTADTLMSGLSGVFASMATLAEKYEVDKTLKEVAKGALGSKGRILSSVLFQAEGASVSLAYNYGTNGHDMTKALVGVGLEIGAGYIVTKAGLAIASAFSAPVWVLVGITAIAAVGIGLFLNTQAGKASVEWVSNNLIKPLIEGIESKLKDFFGMFDSHPQAYELIENPRLESKDYKALIELLLNKDSNAFDIDTLLHSFPNYLKKDSVSTQDSTNSKDSPIHLESKESTLCPNNVNAHRKGEIHFAFHILDKDAKTPIPNAEIQLENINLGVKALTDSRGLVSFSLPESEYLKSFRARLIYPNYYPTPISDRSIIVNALRDKIQVLRFERKKTIIYSCY